MTKAIILAGGIGSRLTEETYDKPKPMVEIGGKPILWHIMKIYYTQGIKDFIICLGYKGYMIKEYFANYDLHNSDVTFDFIDNKKTILHNTSENWRVTLIDTGQETMTGGRLKRVMPLVAEDEHFCLTYGDGVANVDVKKLIQFHQQHGKLATLTAVKPDGRFGALDLGADNAVHQFSEKPAGDGGYINGGFFVLSPKVADYLQDDSTIFERAPLNNLTADGQLAAYTHKGFWKPMDTLRDKVHLNELWDSGQAAWKIWQ